MIKLDVDIVFKNTRADLESLKYEDISQINDFFITLSFNEKDHQPK